MLLTATLYMVLYNQQTHIRLSTLLNSCFLHVTAERWHKYGQVKHHSVLVSDSVEETN